MTRALLLVLLVSAGLAGCVGDDGIESTNVEAGGDEATLGGDLEVLATQELPSVPQVTSSAGAFEPSVDVAPDGTIYVTAPQAPDQDRSLLWVSHDEGGVFERIPWADPETGVSNLPVGFEGDVGVDEAGNIYRVDTTNAGTTVARSTDGGHTWELRNANTFLLPGGDRPWVEGGREDEVVVAWDRPHADTDGFVGVQAPIVAVSEDGGLTFPVQTDIEPCAAFPGAPSGGQDDPIYENGDLAVAPDGTIYLSVNCLGHGIEVHRSTDGGESFEVFAVRESLNVGPDFSPVTVDEAGNVYVTWRAYSNGTANVYYAASRDHGETWSGAVRVSVHEGASLMPWIEAREPGHLALAYYGAPGQAGIPAELGDNATWFPFATEIRAAMTDEPRLFQARMTDHPVARGPQCGPQDPCPGDAQTDLIDYLGTDLGPDGRVHVAWTTDHEGRPHQVSWGAAAETGGEGFP